jgi:hypothetical protein
MNLKKKNNNFVRDIFPAGVILLRQALIPNKPFQFDHQNFEAFQSSNTV